MEKNSNIKWIITAFVVLAAVLIFLPWIVPEYLTILLTRALVLSIVALSLNILIGYTGIGQLGHAGFFAVGGYTTAILATRFHANLLTTLFSSIGMATVAAAIAALLLLKATGLYLLMISLAIAMCIWGITYRWVSMTGGDNGITSIPRPHLDFFGNLAGTTGFYYFVLFFFIICLILMILIVSSPYGKTLAGIRDSEKRMKVLGYNVWLHKYLAVLIASAFAGLGGNLYAYYNTFISPTVADLGTCMDFVLMVIIGGPGTMVGPVVGSIIIVGLKELVSVYTTRWLLFLGGAYIITALYAPEGIMGLWRKYYGKKVTI